MYYIYSCNSHFIHILSEIDSTEYFYFSCKVNDLYIYCISVSVN